MARGTNVDDLWKNQRNFLFLKKIKMLTHQMEYFNLVHDINELLGSIFLFKFQTKKIKIFKKLLNTIPFIPHKM